MRGSIDIDASTLKKAITAIDKKRGICRILPRARFYIQENGDIDLAMLVCDNRMGGKQTGAGAESCKNCKGGQR